MIVLRHHIYEYEKGIRNLVLHTLTQKYREEAEELLSKKNIAYVIYEVSSEKINIFFGNTNCIEVIKYFGDKSLSKYTPEEDFILGVLLGYNQLKQCERYLKMVEKYNFINKLN